MKFSNKAEKLLNMAVCPSLTNPEMEAAAIAFIKQYRKDCAEAAQLSATTNSEPVAPYEAKSAAEAIVEQLEEARKGRVKKPGIVPVGAWKGYHVSVVPRSTLYYFKDNPEGFKRSFVLEVEAELDRQGQL